MSEDERIDLGGIWNLRSETGIDIEAIVPGCVHTSLLAAGLIKDPYYRDNELTTLWIGENPWTYERTFEITADWLLRKKHVILVAEGLDTLAEIHINGCYVASSDNMFHSWEFQIGKFLKEGSNHIRIRFDSALRFVREKHRENPYNLAGVLDDRYEGSNWLRKEQCNFGWDWGPRLVTCGIWKPIRIENRAEPRIHSVYVKQQWEDDGVTLLPCLDVSPCPDGSKAAFQLLDPMGDEAATWDCRVDSIEGWSIDSPDKWWPNGMGAQPLYRLAITIFSPEGLILARHRLRIGLRKLELMQTPDAWGRSFGFRVNGVDFFAKGANWIPADCFDDRVRDEDLRDLLKSCVDANMNMIRVWGGGIYERDRFYDICDELGLCVWQDFMFACAAYPFRDKAFADNVKREAEATVTRLRHHPSLACWCGNNEIEQFPGLVSDRDGAMTPEEYRHGFVELLGKVVERLDPDRSYFRSSPFTPHDDRLPAWDEGSGDQHNWSVWHARKPVEHYEESFPRFCSEFGFQSFPESGTLKAICSEAEFYLDSMPMDFHQRSPEGNQILHDYMKDWFAPTRDFRKFIWQSQLLQAEAVDCAVRHWRRNTPRCMGALYWQLNDCWPAPSWASIDYRHRWKALHYFARRFFASQILSFVADREKALPSLWLTCDPLAGIEGEVELSVQTTAGSILYRGTYPVACAGGESEIMSFDDAEECIKGTDLKGLVVTAFLHRANRCAAREFFCWVKPKDLNVPEANLELNWLQDGTGFAQLKVSSDQFCPYVWMSCDAYNVRFSDNFFFLRAGESRVVSVSPYEGTVGLSAVKEHLKVHRL